LRKEERVDHLSRLMVYDEELSNRIRRVLGARKEVAERKMLGCLAFLFRGGMMVRVSDDEYETDVGKPHVGPMDFTGKPLRGFV
jgi:hypothetical protein